MPKLYLMARLYRWKEILWYELPRGLKNFWKFRSEIWNHCDYDFNGMLRLMQKSSRLLSDHIYKHDHLARAKKSAKQARVFSELCRRIADEDQYYQRPYFRSRGRYDFHNIKYRYDYDVWYLSKLAKYIPYWWD